MVKEKKLNINLKSRKTLLITISLVIIVLIFLSSYIYLSFFNISNFSSSQSLQSVSVSPFDIEYNDLRELEQNQLNSALTSQQKIRLHLEFSERRLSEVLEVYGRDITLADNLLVDYNNHLSNAIAENEWRMSDTIYNMLQKHSRIVYESDNINFEQKIKIDSYIYSSTLNLLDRDNKRAIEYVLERNEVYFNFVPDNLDNMDILFLYLNTLQDLTMNYMLMTNDNDRNMYKNQILNRLRNQYDRLGTNDNTQNLRSEISSIIEIIEL